MKFKKFPEIFILVFILLSVNLFAQQEAVESATFASESARTITSYDDNNKSGIIIYDSSDVNMRVPADRYLDKYRNDSDFDYDRHKGETISILEEIQRFIDDLLNRLFREVYSSGPGRLFGALLALAIIAFLVYLIVSGKGMVIRDKIFGKKDLSRIPADDIRKMDLNKLLDEALRKSDYKNAVRYRFLLLLKQLNDSGRINWKPEKTNSDYLREIRDTALQNDVFKAVMIFEYVWYGDFEADKQLYGRLDSIRIQQREAAGQ